LHALLIDAASLLLASGQGVKKTYPFDVPTIPLASAVCYNYVIKRLLFAAAATQTYTDHNHPLATWPVLKPAENL
jgi:hypothetical protein